MKRLSNANKQIRISLALDPEVDEKIREIAYKEKASLAWAVDLLLKEALEARGVEKFFQNQAEPIRKAVAKRMLKDAAKKGE